MNDPIRLNKHLAHQLGISRREADDLIARGAVRINGEVAVLGSRMNEGDELTVRGKPVAHKTGFTYIMLHKPVGYICSRKRQGDTPTIYELLPEDQHNLKPVGRLDKDSSGLLLLTDDGDLAHEMTHPKFYKTKVYEVELDHPLEPLHQQMISDHGITLEDGVSKFMVQKEDAHYVITMSEGRNRQIRRTFDALDYTVTRLHRIQFGSYHIGDLAAGATLEFKL